MALVDIRPAAPVLSNVSSPSAEANMDSLQRYVDRFPSFQQDRENNGTPTFYDGSEEPVFCFDAEGILSILGEATIYAALGALGLLYWIG